MKRIIIMVLCMCMTVSVFASNASAAIISDRPLTEEELQEASRIPAPMIYTTCTGGNGICQMYAQGWAYVYDENGNYFVNPYLCVAVRKLLHCYGDIWRSQN